MNTKLNRFSSSLKEKKEKKVTCQPIKREEYSLQAVRSFLSTGLPFWAFSPPPPFRPRAADFGLFQGSPLTRFRGGQFCTGFPIGVRFPAWAGPGHE